MCSLNIQKYNKLMIQDCSKFRYTQSSKNESISPTEQYFFAD